MLDSTKLNMDKPERTFTIRRFGNVVEVKEYEDTYAPKKLTEYEKHRLKSEREKRAWYVMEDEEKEQDNRRRSATRAMTEVRQLVLENFDVRKGKFFTLTYEENVTDVDRANKDFKRFIQKLRYRYGKEFKFLVVIEFQKRGAVHFHVLLDENFPLVPVNRDKVRELKKKGKITQEYKEKENLTDLWGFGFVSIEQIGHVNDLGKYLIKYMIKDFGDERLRGKKNYHTSRNVKRPEKIVDYDEVMAFIQKHNLQKKETAFTTSYYSEWVGTVILREYRID